MGLLEKLVAINFAVTAEEVSAPRVAIVVCERNGETGAGKYLISGLIQLTVAYHVLPACKNVRKTVNL